MAELEICSSTNSSTIHIYTNERPRLLVPQTKAIISIENVVASASVNQRVDLNLITKKFVDVEYHPDQFPGLVIRLKEPKTATLVFSSGKMVCTGAKSEEQ
jgi:transcription initiation factor TFIID TATA-box-binding protein